MYICWKYRHHICPMSYNIAMRQYISRMRTNIFLHKGNNFDVLPTSIGVRRGLLLVAIHFLIFATYLKTCDYTSKVQVLKWLCLFHYLLSCAWFALFWGYDTLIAAVLAILNSSCCSLFQSSYDKPQVHVWDDVHRTLWYNHVELC